MQKVLKPKDLLVKCKIKIRNKGIDVSELEFDGLRIRDIGIFYKIESDFVSIEKAKDLTSKIFHLISYRVLKDMRNRISFEFKFPNKFDIHFVNLTKLVLGFDEASIYKSLPEIKNLLGSQSIKNLKTDLRLFNNSNPSHFWVPKLSTTGINFYRLKEGIIDLQYFRGKDVFSLDILTTILRSVDSISRCIIRSKNSPNTYTKREKAEFLRIAKRYKKIIDSCKTFRTFAKLNPKVKFTIDLENNPLGAEAHFINNRDTILNIAANLFPIEKIHLNYDSSLKRFQIKGGKIEAHRLMDLDLIEVDIDSGTFMKCYALSCKIKNTVFAATHFDDCKIFNSMIIDSAMEKNNEAEKVIFSGKASILDGNIKRSKITNGLLKSSCKTFGSRVSKNVKISYV